MKRITLDKRYSSGIVTIPGFSSLDYIAQEFTVWVFAYQIAGSSTYDEFKALSKDHEAISPIFVQNGNSTCTVDINGLLSEFDPATIEFKLVVSAGAVNYVDKDACVPVTEGDLTSGVLEPEFLKTQTALIYINDLIEFSATISVPPFKSIDIDKNLIVNEDNQLNWEVPEVEGEIIAPPDNTVEDSGNILAININGEDLEWVVPDIDPFPMYENSDAHKVLSVNAAGDALEWIDDEGRYFAPYNDTDGDMSLAVAMSGRNLVWGDLHRPMFALHLGEIASLNPDRENRVGFAVSDTDTRYTSVNNIAKRMIEDLESLGDASEIEVWNDGTIYDTGIPLPESDFISEICIDLGLSRECDSWTTGESGEEILIGNRRRSGRLQWISTSELEDLVPYDLSTAPILTAYTTSLMFIDGYQGTRNIGIGRTTEGTICVSLPFAVFFPDNLNVADPSKGMKFYKKILRAL